MSLLHRFAAASASLAVAASGVVAAGAGPASAAGDIPAPRTIRVSISGSHVVSMPTRIRPGAHRFVITSTRRAAFQLLQAVPGYTKAEASRDIYQGLNKGNTRAQKRFEAHVQFLGGAPSLPGHPAVMWTRLSAGTYWALDSAPARTRASKVLTVRVAGPRVSGQIQSTATVRAIHETDWAARPRQIGHAGRLTFRNDSEDNHFVELAKLAPGKTVADFRKWIADAKNGVQSPPPIDPRAVLDTGVVSPGHRMTMRYSLPRGSYVMLCWWPDADMGGMPHAFMGMYRGITLR